MIPIPVLRLIGPVRAEFRWLVSHIVLLRSAVLEII
jgi:hypothetical protein